ncbi:MAG TPA: precorrin-3B C(17)-methyltransferase [Acidimicrobiales bacterium]|nr:precorrin-3B C(17)-methyltransferase [Acidimicrobiales bacterium]
MTDPRTVVVTVTQAGADLAARLPYEHRHGRLGETVREVWDDADRLVLVGATGIAVRVIAPLLDDKRTDPAVVAVDDGGRWAVALAGGHHGANALAREVAGLVGAEPVVTTATEAAGLPALDDLPGFRTTGDVAALTRAWLDGTPPTLDHADLPHWPLPPALADLPSTPATTTSAAAADQAAPAHPVSTAARKDLVTSADTGARSDRGGPTDPAPLDTPAVTIDSADPASLASRVEATDLASGVAATARAAVIRVTDRVGVGDASPHQVVLRPGSLVVGVGSSSGADPQGIAELVAASLAAAGLSPEAIGLVASVDLKRTEPGIVALADRHAVELRTFPADVLATIHVPTPSTVVEAAVGTPSVAEAAALLAAGPGAELVVTKQRSTEATVAVARRARPEGHLAVVGLGPGDPAWRTPAAAAAVRGADVVIGYGLYIDLAADLLAPHHEIVRSPIGAETDRCSEALERAAAGQRVALVCSGDPGVFAMASLVCELAPAQGNPPTTVVPGVTAAYGAAAVLGAPLGHDHAMVSLSDLLTPWPLIERRLVAVAEGDLAVSFYNPRSQRRTWQLGRALEILAAHRPPACPVAIVSDVGRAGRQRIVRTTLAAFDPALVDMLSLVVVGSSTTRWQGDVMVTPRGYPAPAPAPAPAEVAS